MSSNKPIIVETVAEIWKIPNIREYINQIHDNRSHYNSSLPRAIGWSIAPYNFMIGKRSKIKDEECLRAQANISVSENNLDLVLTISLQEEQQITPWEFNIKFTSISFEDDRGHHLGTLSNQWRSCAAFEQCNLMTSNCTSHLPFDSTTIQSMSPQENSMIINFSMTCKITKSEITLEPESEIDKIMDFHHCESQALNDYKDLLKDSTTADVKIVTNLGECQSFDCHKPVLAARSPVLRAMFETAMKETQENVVKVEDISGETMEHFLSFLYCGRFQNESWVKYIPQLTYAADKYCVSSLKRLCDTNLIKSVTCENALAIADLAHRHQLPNAVLDIRRFIEKNARKLSLDFAAATKSLEM